MEITFLKRVEFHNKTYRDKIICWNNLLQDRGGGCVEWNYRWTKGVILRGHLLKLGDEYVGFHYTSLFLYVWNPHIKVLASLSRQVKLKFLIQIFQVMLVDEPYIENQRFTNIIVKVLNDLDLTEFSLIPQKSLFHLLYLIIIDLCS